MNTNVSRAGKGDLLLLFKVFFKISALTVGGGLTMLPIINEEFVTKRKYMTDEEMVDIVAVVQSMPGIIAVNMSVMIGYRIAGIKGAFLASIGMILPPFIVISLISLLLGTLKQNEILNNAFLGIRAALCALILLTVIQMGRTSLKKILPIIIATISFFILVVFPQFNAIWVIVAGGITGIAASYIPLIFKKEKNENG